MTEKMRNDPKVKEAEDFLKRWMSLTPMKKERAKGYLECLEGTEQYQQPQKTAQEVNDAGISLYRMLCSSISDYDKNISHSLL